MAQNPKRQVEDLSQIGWAIHWSHKKDGGGLLVSRPSQKPFLVQEEKLEDWLRSMSGIQMNYLMGPTPASLLLSAQTAGVQLVGYPGYGLPDTVTTAKKEEKPKAILSWLLSQNGGGLPFVAADRKIQELRVFLRIRRQTQKDRIRLANAQWVLNRDVRLLPGGFRQEVEQGMIKKGIPETEVLATKVLGTREAWAEKNALQLLSEIPVWEHIKPAFRMSADEFVLGAEIVAETQDIQRFPTLGKYKAYFGHKIEGGRLPKHTRGQPSKFSSERRALLKQFSKLSLRHTSPWRPDYDAVRNYYESEHNLGKCTAPNCKWPKKPGHVHSMALCKIEDMMLKDVFFRWWSWIQTRVEMEN